MTTSQIARADAQFQEQIHAQWRDWRAFLQAQLVLLDTQASHQRPAFERDESREEGAAEAQRTVASLPPAQRALFERVREERRQQLQADTESSARRNGARRQPLDLDAIDRTALAGLLAAAEGTDGDEQRPAGWGEVPLLVDGAVQWYRVHVPTLREAPSAAAYAASSDADDLRKRFALAGLLVALAVLFPIVWFLWPRGAARTAEARPQALVSGVPVTPWQVQRIELTTADGASRAVELRETRTAAWDGAPAGGGLWRSAGGSGLAICVPQGALANIVAARIIGGSDIPDRVYALDASATEASLTIQACDGSGARIAGRLIAAEDLTEQAIGAPVALADEGQIRVRAIRIVGAAEDPLLPPDAARIIVEVAAPALDWPSFAPTLLLADGTALQAPEVRATDGGAELRYLTARPQSPLTVAWSLRAPGTTSGARWRATLAPPIDRAALLRTALRVSDVALTEADGESAITLTITNAGGIPLALRADDATFQRGAETLPAPGWDSAEPLAPGDLRRMTITLPAGGDQGGLALTIGQYRWQIAP